VRTQPKPDHRTGWALLSAAAALWLTLAPPEPVRELPTTTHRFLCYFSGLQKSGQPLSLWDRLAISLVLAGQEAGRPRSGSREPAS
jgi:hypothetical protein